MDELTTPPGVLLKNAFEKDVLGSSELAAALQLDAGLADGERLRAVRRYFVSVEGHMIRPAGANYGTGNPSSPIGGLRRQVDKMLDAYMGRFLEPLRSGELKATGLRQTDRARVVIDRMIWTEWNYWIDFDNGSIREGGADGIEMWTIVLLEQVRAPTIGRSTAPTEKSIEWFKQRCVGAEHGSKEEIKSEYLKKYKNVAPNQFEIEVWRAYAPGRLKKQGRPKKTETG